MRAVIKGMKEIYALDLGTTKFCIAAIRESTAPEDRGWKVDTISVPADGMRRGMVANMDQAKAALDQLVSQAEIHFSTDIRKVVVGIAGSHLKGQSVSCIKSLPDGQVTHKDAHTLTENVERDNTVNGREVLHTIPLGYSVDGRPRVDSPFGLHGKNLEGHYFLIDADQSYLRDVLNICNASGLQVLRFYSEPVASASVTIPDSLKENGIAMADIGGGTTDGIVFRNGRPVSIFTINIAGKLMTHDLAIGLSVPQPEAERAKLYFGIGMRDNGTRMDIHDLQNHQKNIGIREMNAILLPRIHELCGLVAKSLLPFRGTLGAGLFLTGGGSEVKGLPEYFQAKMGIPVLKTKPKLPEVDAPNEIGREDKTQNDQPTKLATVLGLLNLEIGRLGDQEKYRQTTWSSKYLGPILNWLKDLT